MRTKVAIHKGVKIWIDERGQFWTGEKNSKNFYNPGTSIEDIKDQLDFLDDYEKATPVKVLRISFPNLDVWNIRKVTLKRHGSKYTHWYTKDYKYQRAYPAEFPIDHDIISYDDAVYAECQRRFKEIEQHFDRFRDIQAAMEFKKLDDE